MKLALLSAHLVLGIVTNTHPIIGYSIHGQGINSTKKIEISTFATEINPNEIGKVKNIELAVKKINSFVLLPGELFSFNKVVGDSNRPQDGWQIASVVVGKKFVKGYGGGICQVTTTLYQSVVNSGLKIQEIHHHSVPLSYISFRHDATVAYPYLDFKFTNTLDDPIFIEAKVQGNLLTCKIYKLIPEE